MAPAGVGGIPPGGVIPRDGHRLGRRRPERVLRFPLLRLSRKLEQRPVAPHFLPLEVITREDIQGVTFG